MSRPSKRAIFLDRDGTLVEPRHYPSRPDDLIFYEGVGEEIRLLRELEFRIVVVTNQSGIARGYFTEEQLGRMHDCLATQLASLGADVDAFYYCPHHPDGRIPHLSVRCDCRKPAPGMLFHAAANLGLDLTHSWLVGDILDDVEAGNRAGCRTVLVDLGTETSPIDSVRRPTFVTPSTVQALRLIRFIEGAGPAVDTSYLPTSWREREPNASSTSSLAHVAVGRRVS